MRKAELNIETGELTLLDLSQQETTAITGGILEAAQQGCRSKRNGLLAETDYLALSDTTLTAEMAAYRQALRDVTAHVNFPYLDEADWPVKP